MLERAVRRGVALLLVVLPVPLLAQGLNIDHKPVGCLVAEKYAKMSACFSPASELARARVYFRAEDGPPNWFYVEMKSEPPCYGGVLPKPKKDLIGKKVLYYVTAFDQKFAENRTVDNAALVVKGASGCTKGVGVAPFAASGPAAVFPGVPAGFAAGGIGSATAVAAGAGGAAVVGGGVALATSGSNNTTPTTPPAGPPPTTQAPATMPTTTTTTTTLAAAPFNASFIIRVYGADIPSDQTQMTFVLPCPVPVEFDMCQSTGPFKLAYNVDVSPQSGSPQTLGGACLLKGWMDGGGFRLSSTGRIVTQAFSFADIVNVMMRVESVAPQNKPWAFRAMTFSFDRTSPKCALSTDEEVGALAANHHLAWASQLDVAGARGQVVINGTTAVFAGPGRSTALAVGRKGENRVEAQLMEAAGEPGTWRFELGPTEGLVAGSLRVLVGSVAETSSNAVVFRLSGRAGERVVFSFRTSN
jgi:hypothetical protein